MLIFTSVTSFIIATVVLIFAIHEAMLNWLASGLLVLLYTRSLRLFLLFRRTTQSNVPTAKDWRIIMIGHLLSTALFLTSGVAGEGWVGFLVAPVMLLYSFTFWFIVKRTETPRKQPGV